MKPALLSTTSFQKWTSATSGLIGKARAFFEGMSRKGQIEKELKYYRTLSLQAPRDVRVKLKIAELAFLKKDIQTAVDMYRDVAEIYDEEQFPMRAIDAYLNVLRLTPTDVSINEKLGKLFQEVGMAEEALQQYEIAFYAYRNQGKHEKSLKMCEEMIRISPLPKHRRKLGEAYQAMGRLEEALNEYEAIAAEYRKDKNVDALLEICKLLLPHRHGNKPFIRDMAILHLHKHLPQDAIRLIEREKLADDEICREVYAKAKEILHEMGKKR